jgi:hypothetical protein
MLELASELMLEMQLGHSNLILRKAIDWMPIRPAKFLRCIPHGFAEYNLGSYLIPGWSSLTKLTRSASKGRMSE